MAKTHTHLETSSTAYHGTYVITHYTLRYSLARWSVGLDCFLPITEPLQRLFSIEPRAPHSGDLGPIVLAWIRVRLPCLHMLKEIKWETHQVQKQRARCKSTLRLITRRPGPTSPSSTRIVHIQDPILEPVNRSLLQTGRVFPQTWETNRVSDNNQ